MTGSAPTNNSDASPTIGLDGSSTGGEQQPINSFEKVNEFRLQIQGRLLDNLGIKMYSKLGKVLVEFAANAYDSDSQFVDIQFDYDAINKERQAVRAQALEKLHAEAKDVDAPIRPRAYIIHDPLPSSFTVKIIDRGHGMTPTEIARRFLPLNKNRRVNSLGQEINLRSEAGKRFVMGRKGIGKLSAFGAAETMKIRSKRSGQDYWTEVTLQSSVLMNASDLAAVAIPHAYIPANAAEKMEQGTIVELSGLRCDSMNFTPDEIRDTLNETFYPIRPAEFLIKLNGTPLDKPKPDLEYWYPASLQEGKLAEDTITDAEWGVLSFKYRVQFRKKSLRADKRGAYIYSKNRLAMEPSILGLNTGMHNFMAHAYMECIVEADDLDNLNVDVIGTNRSSVITDSELVRSFLARVTTLMEDGIRAHSNYREVKAEEELDHAPSARRVRDILNMIPPGQKKAARQLSKIFIARYGVESPEFEQVAPLIVGTVNAGEVLVELIKVSINPSSVTDIANRLVELRQIEKSDALKAFRGRRNGILGLQKLMVEGEDNFNKGPHDEKTLHRLLRDNPWLVRPELAEYVTSDQTISELLDRLSKDLEIDRYAKQPVVSEKDSPDEKEIKETSRPDLVTVIGNSTIPDRILIIELKAPSLPLRIEHLQQLRRYMRKVEEFLQTEYSKKRPIVVEGVLIGAMPDPNTKSDPQRDLLSEIQKRGSGESWEVVGLRELLRRTEVVHRELIDALKKDEDAGLAEDAAATTQALGSS